MCSKFLSLSSRTEWERVARNTVIYCVTLQEAQTNCRYFVTIGVCGRQRGRSTGHCHAIHSAVAGAVLYIVVVIYRRPVAVADSQSNRLWTRSFVD